MHIQKWCFLRQEEITETDVLYRGTEFEHMTLHKLRHCNATLLLNAGVELSAISEHLGHCDVNITATIYADVLWGLKKTVAASIENSLTI